MENKILDCLIKVKGQTFDHKNHLISEGYISSFELLELIVSLEEEFLIQIPLQMISPERFDSVDEIRKLVEECRKEKE